MSPPLSKEHPATHLTTVKEALSLVKQTHGPVLFSRLGDTPSTAPWVAIACTCMRVFTTVFDTDMESADEHRPMCPYCGHSIKQNHIHHALLSREEI